MASAGSWLVYYVPIHTDPKQSVEKMGKDLNDKVCMSINVCVFM